VVSDPVIVVGGARVFAGDCREALKHLPDNSVDSVVTDPPYELGFMGKKWDSSGIAYDPAVWAECLRVLKPGGHLLAFGGSRTFHRLGVAIEDAGFEIRDTIAWISSKTFPKSLNVSKAIDKKLGAEREVLGVDKVRGNAPSMMGRTDPSNPDYDGSTVGVGTTYITAPSTFEAQQWEGWGTGLKQVVEPVVMARKPLDGTVAENTLRWGVGGLNIDESRIATSDSFGGGAKATSGFVNGYQNDGWVPGSAKGRWPANVILDEVSADIVDGQSGVTKDGVAVRRNGNSGAGMFPVKIADDSADVGFGGSGGASRFFYVAKASKRDRNEGLEELEAVDRQKWNGSVGHRGVGDFYPDGSPRPVNPQSNTHPTVKPTQLMRYLIKLVTPEGGVVLDPFTGSGSTGKAALLDGFQFVGVELTEEYLPIIEGRLRWASEQVDDDDTLF
jgi:site-specific DNA-methyltransferase (adenine-specific)